MTEKVRAVPIAKPTQNTQRCNVQRTVHTGSEARARAGRAPLPATVQRALGNHGMSLLLARNPPKQHEVANPAQIAHVAIRHEEKNARQGSTPTPSAKEIDHNAPKQDSQSLKVNPPGDQHEQAADALATRVMQSTGAAERVVPHPPIEQIEALTTANARRTTEVSGTTGAPSVPAQTATLIRNPGAGHPLPVVTRSRIEPHLGADLGTVRVHSGPSAATAALTLGARAFTHDMDIFLGAGESMHDTRLMAHEATHVVQQSGTPVQRMPIEEEVQRLPEMAQTEGRARGIYAAPASSSTTGMSTPAAPTPTARSTLATTVPTPVTPEVAAPSTPSTVYETPAAGAPVAPTAVSGASAPTAPPMGSATEPGVGETGELLMPEPPTELSAEEQARLAEVQGRVGAAASASEEVPPADSQVDEARGAVEEPQEETVGRAESALVAALDQRPQPSPEIEELCERIYTIIRSKRPPDEESLVEAEPDEMAREAGGQLDSAVQGNVQNVEGSYSSLQQEQTGTPTQVPQEMGIVPESVPTGDINASAATPSGVAAEDVSLEADVTANRERIEEAGMNSEAAQLIQDPSNPVVQGREAQGELEETAQRDPVEVMAEQQAALTSASTDMAALQQHALEALQSARSDTVQGTHGQQLEMVGSEEQMRTQISTQARAIVTSARTRVQDLLRPMPDMARRRWDTGVAVLSTTFEHDLARVKEWIDERHSGVGGAILGIADYLTGLPDWVTEEYDRAEQAFGDGVCSLLREISTEVNGVIAAAEAIIATANQDVDELFTNLPAELQEWAVGERNSMDEQLSALHNEVRQTQRNINQQLTESASGAVQQVRERIHELRQAAGGLVGRIVDAVSRFLDDPLKFIIEGLLSLVGIPPASFWALVNRIQQVISDIVADPLGFAGKLLSAIGQGFQQFFERFGQHLIAGFWDWLFSGLGSVGVEIPTDFSLKSIITFILQLMGISWARIRRLLAKHIGEENVALIEKAYELVANLIALGPSGIFELIKEQLNPQNILDQILHAAIDFLTDALIKQVTVRVAMLFNPVGAIAQAIMAIYKVIKWIFENAARIFSLVETVVNGMADIIAGNIGGMANAVEQSLARLIAPVIDFIAELVGLGDIPNKIADTIKGFQEWVEGILDRVIGFLANQARRLLRAVGIRGGEDDHPNAAGDGEVGKRITFRAAGEGHQLWINIQGSSVRVMVASGSGTEVGQKLDDWQRRLETLSEEQRTEARQLIDTARQLLVSTQANAEQAEQKKEQTEREPTNPQAIEDFSQADNQTESTEQSLADIEKRLFEIFGEPQFETVDVTAPNGMIIPCAKRGSVLVPINKVAIYPMGRVRMYPREELRHLQEFKQRERKQFDRDPRNEARLVEIRDRLKHNYERSQEMFESIKSTGMSDSVADINAIIQHLLIAGESVTLETRREHPSTIEGPLGSLRVNSTWTILPDGTRYLSTINFFPTKGG